MQRTVRRYAGTVLVKILTEDAHGIGPRMHAQRDITPTNTALLATNKVVLHEKITASSLPSW